MQAVMQEYRLDQDSGKWILRGAGQEEDEEGLLDEALNFIENMMSS